MLCKDKKRYFTKKAAKISKKRLQDKFSKKFYIYNCTECEYYHLASKRHMNYKKKIRTIQSKNKKWISRIKSRQRRWPTRQMAWCASCRRLLPSRATWKTRYKTHTKRTYQTQSNGKSTTIRRCSGCITTRATMNAWRTTWGI